MFVGELSYSWSSALPCTLDIWWVSERTARKILNHPKVILQMYDRDAFSRRKYLREQCSSDADLAVNLK